MISTDKLIDELLKLMEKRRHTIQAAATDMDLSYAQLHGVLKGERGVSSTSLWAFERYGVNKRILDKLRQDKILYVDGALDEDHKHKLSNREKLAIGLTKLVARRKHFIRDAANWMNISEGHLSEFLKGERNASFQTLQAFADYGVDHELVDNYWQEKQTKQRTVYSKQVYQYTLDGEFLKIYNSASDAAKETGVLRKNISRNCRGKAKSAGGFIWKYNGVPYNLKEMSFCQCCGTRIGQDERAVISIECLKKFKSHI